MGDLRIRGPHPRGSFAAKPGDPWVDVTVVEPSSRRAVDRLGGRPLRSPPQQLAQMQTTVKAPGFEPTGRWSYGLGIAKKP